MSEHFETLPHHPKLGRNIAHDAMSVHYRPRRAKIASAVFPRFTPILDQGQIGKCTCEAAGGILGTAPFWPTVASALQTTLSEESTADEWTSALYHDETELEDPTDAFPPNDPGGSGLFVSKVLKARGLVAGYTHALGLQEALGALTLSPGLLGIPWYNSMFDAATDGTIKVDPTSGLAGGHELLIREIDVTVDSAGDPSGWVWLDNSWGSSWGAAGRGKLSVSDFDYLLKESGDVTIPTPLAAPAPSA